MSSSTRTLAFLVVIILVSWLGGVGLGKVIWDVPRGHEGYVLDNLVPITGKMVDLKPFGVHLIPCLECGFTYRFFYNAPGFWQSMLSHDPVATGIMRDMMKTDKMAPDEKPKNGPPEPEEPGVEL